MSDTPNVNSTPTEGQGEESSQGQEQNQDGRNPPAPKAPKRFIKVDDESIDEETIARDYKKWKGADQKFREVAQARQSIEAFYEALQNDPEKVLGDPRLPIKKRELAMKWLREQVEEELQEVDPKDQKLSEVEKELKKYKDQEAKQKQDAEKQEYQKVVDSRREAIATTLTKALELSPLSKSPDVQAEVLKEMAGYLRMCRQAGHDVTPDELAAHVQRNRMSSYHTLANQLEGDELIGWLGEAIVKKIRKADLARIDRQHQAPPPDVAEDWSPSERKQKREIIDPATLMRRK